MALTQCTECGKDISEQALLCPHCGFLYEKAIRTIRRKSSNIWMSLIVLLCVGITTAALVYPEYIPRQHIVGSDQHGAVKYCKQLVSARLFRPETADYLYQNAIHEGDDVYLYKTSVDSINNYGRVTRIAFTCRAKRIGYKKWKTVTIELGKGTNAPAKPPKQPAP